MAVEVENAGQVQEVLRILRKRSWWIAVPAILVLAVGSAFAVIVPKKYVCSTTIVVRNPFGDVPRFESRGVGEAQIAAHQIRSGDRISKVLHDLGWRDFTQLPPSRTGEYISKIATNIGVQLPTAAKGDDKQIVKITFAHTSARRCFDFLERMSAVWQDEILERDRRAHEEAWQSLNRDRNHARLQRDDLLEEIAKLRRDHGIDVPLYTRGGSAFSVSDPSFARRREEETRALELQDEIKALETALAKDRERFAVLPAMSSKSRVEGGVDNEERIDKHRLEIKQLRNKQERYLQQHSEWRRIEREIHGLEEEIALLEQGELDPVAREQEIPNEERLKLADKIEKDEDKLDLRRLALTQVLERMADADGRLRERISAEQQIASLEKKQGEVEAGLVKLNEQIAASSMAHELRLSPLGNPFEVLDSPRRPNRPTEPNPLLIVLFSLAGGLAFGLGLAALVEYNKSCFRTVADVARIMAVPVLGTINTIRTERERLRVRTTHTVVGGATFLFVASLAFVTWAWSSRPQMLSSPLRDAIEELRESFE